MRHPIGRRDMIRSLEEKGFERTDSDRDHDYYYFTHRGERTIVRTKVSRGSKYGEYDDGLFRLMRGGLRLNTIAQVRDLLFCPMTRDDYVAYLRANGVLRQE